MKHVIAMITCLLVAGCTERSAPVPAAALQATSSAAQEPQVRWFGALHAIMHEGRTAAAVRIADVVPGPHAWGLGALEGLLGEVTVLDDVVWLARPMPDGSARVTRGDLTGLDKEQGAALFVVANVAAWDELPITQRVASAALDAYLEAALEARAYALGAPVPLRIEGPLSALHWHVVDGSKLAPGAGHAEHARTAVSGTAERLDATLVGFYSREHQGVFTHAGSSSHFHVVSRDGLVTGHVDAVDLLPGARLLVPRSARL